MPHVAVRPPEYLPRLAYCALFFRVDRFVVADTFPYSRQSFQNRARVRTPEQGGQQAQWMTVPLRAGRCGRPIRTMTVADPRRHAAKHRHAVTYNYSTAPYYEHYAPDLFTVLDRAGDALGPLTAATVAWTHRALRAPCALTLASALPGAPSDVTAVLRACEADTLVTLPESKASDRTAADAAGAALEVLDFVERPRRQNFPGFEPGLSVLDLLMNYGPDAARLLGSGAA